MSSLLNQQQLLPRVATILNTPTIIVDTLFNYWNHAFDLLHADPSLRPTLLQLIGSNGVELFQLNHALTTFMMTQLSGVRNDVVEQIQNKLNTLPGFIFNEDGTVTEAPIEVIVPELSGEEIIMPELSGEEIVMPELSGEEIEVPELSGEEIEVPELSGEEIEMPE
jgi:hypothetical protein